MPANLFDWTIRAAMMVLAALVTLSILGSIAAISSDEAGRGFAARQAPPPIEGERAVEPAPEPVPPARDAAAEAENQASPEAAAGREGRAGAGTGLAAVPAEAQKEDERARWLEAIAYALLAIAGIAGIAVLMLWRVVRELRRMGDLALSRPPRP
jgi:hypothetical protein